MISFLQRVFPARGRFRHIPKFCGGLLLLVAAGPLFGQSPPSSLQGTWMVNTPDEGRLVVLIKNEGLASYFWGENADRTVYRGEWTGDAQSAEIRWANGHALRLERSGADAIATARDAAGRELYTAPARQLPPEILGQWAKPPTREEALRSDLEQAQGFFGIWKVGNDAPEYVFVESDRSAASTFGRDSNSPRGQRGQWAKQGSELHIIWDDGTYAILRESDRGFNYQQIPSGQIIEEDKSTPQSAIRTQESTVPGEWLTRYREELEAAAAGIAFADRKSASAFYRGEWIIRRGENRFERIALARFGGLSTTEDPALKGQWRLSGQDVFMRWDDGMRKILAPLGHGFVLYEYRPGRPLDGVPARVFPAAPADAGKLEAHLKDRAVIGQQMAAMAQAAGGQAPDLQRSGWGRSFARWVWPFGKEASPASADALLAEEFAEETAADPWWWPFWSESSKPAEPSAAAVEADAPVSPVNTEAAPSSAPETEAAPTAEPTPETTAEPTTAAPAAPKRATKNWLWPFDI